MSTRANFFNLKFNNKILTALVGTGQVVMATGFCLGEPTEILEMLVSNDKSLV
jgi:hypothetical protein